jgi:hypothetical protein
LPQRRRAAAPFLAFKIKICRALLRFRLWVESGHWQSAQIRLAKAVMSIDELMTGSQQTQWLAPIVGTYLCLSALGAIRGEETGRFIADLRDHPGAMHAVGAIAFFVGASLLSLHRHWSSPPEILLNVVAAWWVFEGAGMLADPARLRAAFCRPGSANKLRLGTLVAALPGVYLVAFGLLGSVR